MTHQEDGFLSDVQKPDAGILAQLLPASDAITQALSKTAQIFCVGGAVRDALLGVQSADRDYVVVGCTVNEMLKAGFTPVGKDFPVFLHPHSKDEYALARTERKSGKGYKGFSFNASPEVTLPEDLSRRDLTINAMATDASGMLIDPFCGLADLQSKILRHVGPAFSEDPVRLLRIARFSARWPEFQIAPQTKALLQKIVDDGEADALVAERVWQEIHAGLMEQKPSQMIHVLCACGAWQAITKRSCPPQETMDALDRCAQANLGPELRYAVLIAYDHEGLSQTFKSPKPCVDMAGLLQASRARLSSLKDFLSNPEKTEELQAFLDWLERLDAFRRPQRVKEMLDGHLALQELGAQSIARIRGLVDAVTDQQTAKSISNAAQKAQQAGTNIAQAVRADRLLALKAIISK